MFGIDEDIQSGWDNFLDYSPKQKSPPIVALIDACSRTIPSMLIKHDR